MRLAELLLIVQSVRVTVPAFSRPPPESDAEPPVIVRPESEVVTLASTWNTPLALLPSMISRFAPGPSIVVTDLNSLSSSGPCVSVIVWVPPPNLKSMVLGGEAALACATAQRRVPVLPSSAVLVTSNVESSRRSSSGSGAGLNRCRSHSRARRSTMIVDHHPAALARRLLPPVPIRMAHLDPGKV